MKKVFTKREKFDRFTKEYSKYDLQLLCSEEGIEFDNPELNIKWLPLNFYDDCTMETLFVDEKINFVEVFTDENGERIRATGKALYKPGEDHEYQWARV